MSTKVPPDGGWGWVIVLANGLNGISIVPVLQIFGLIFKDCLADLNLNATDVSIIINVNLASGMMLGMITGALLKTYGYKKVAIAGSILHTVGIILTAFANSFSFFIIWYGILTSIGFGMLMSGFSLAINVYFTKRRDRAMGLAITITALGPILMPQIASFLLIIYGTQETMLILGAYSFHSMIAALLLQPVEWHMKTVPICLETIHCSQKDESVFRRIWQRMADLYDLDLLRDPIYINIMFGMSIAIFAELNFSMLTPFILADKEMTTAQIANVMSVIAMIDLIGRGGAPYLGEWLHQSPRMMYMLSLFLLTISRTLLIFTNSFSSVTIVASGLGLAKGIRSVYMTLVVPSYVPLHKLASASGIQMLINGIMMLCAGPILGLIRDSTGNYTICIILINALTLLTIFIWTVEILVQRRSARKKSKLPES